MPLKYNSLSFPAERVKELYDYDPETGYLLSRDSRWAGRPIIGSFSKGMTARQVRLYHEDGSRTVSNYGRVVFAWHNNRWPEGEIDHVDRDFQNNRIENLREADRSLQTQNRLSFNYGTYKFKGTQKWRALINRKSLGLFNTQKAAQEAFMAKCDEIGKTYLPATLVGDRYVPTERVMGER